MCKDTLDSVQEPLQQVGQYRSEEAASMLLLELCCCHSLGRACPNHSGLGTPNTAHRLDKRTQHHASRHVSRMLRACGKIGAGGRLQPGFYSNCSITSAFTRELDLNVLCYAIRPDDPAPLHPHRLYVTQIMVPSEWLLVLRNPTSMTTRTLDSDTGLCRTCSSIRYAAHAADVRAQQTWRGMMRCDETADHACSQSPVPPPALQPAVPARHMRVAPHGALCLSSASTPSHVIVTCTSP